MPRVRLSAGLLFVEMICPCLVFVQGVYTHSEWAKNTVDQFSDNSVDEPAHMLTLHVPRFNMRPHLWFNADRELSELNEIDAKLGVELNADPDDNDSTAARRASAAFARILAEDFAASKKISARVEKLNAGIVARPYLRLGDSFSLIEETDVTDWAYCACGSGVNGTFVFPERDWPPKSSLLQVTVGGRHLSIPRSDKCNCVNPWEGVDSSRQACTLNNGVTICLVSVDTKGASPEQISTQAANLLKGIDDAYHL